MTNEELLELPVGVYRIFWKSGGHSVAAIGCVEDGEKWIAPANWLTPVMPSEKVYGKSIDKIERVELIEQSFEQCDG